MANKGMQGSESGLSDRVLLLILVLGFFIGCVVVPPVPIELTKFADNASTKNLTFDSSENETFELNLTKYIAVGPDSMPPNGTISNFSFYACPHEHLGSNVSNLRIYWPTGGSSLLYAGELTSCQRLYADPVEFNEYLATHSAPPFLTYFAGIMGGGLPSINNFTISFLMLKNPRMHNVGEEVTYQFAIPYGPIEMIANLSGQSVPEEFAIYENSRITGLRYTCFEGDQLREKMGVDRSWNLSLTVPPMNVSPIIDTNETITVTAVFNLHELPCPAYAEPGKYHAEVRSVYAYIWNYTGWIPTTVFEDDFNSTVLDPIWDVRAVDGAGTAEVVNDFTHSKAILRSNSPLNDSGIIMYYSDPITIPTSNDSGVYIEVAIPTGETEMVGGGFAGVFMINETVDPGASAAIGPNVRGMFIHNQHEWAAFCPGSFSPNASGTFILPGETHRFVIVILNDSIIYLLDDIPVLYNCTPPTEDFYLALSPDPVTDMWDGNMSIGYVQILDVDYATNWTGTMWVDMGLLPFGRSQADIIVCDCPGQYGRIFDFNISSDTAGILEMSEVNVSYKGLISYSEDGTTPTSSIDTDSFSWVAINSDISASSVGYQSGMYNSTVTNSEVVLSSLYCNNVTDSEMVLVFMINDPTILGLIGSAPPCDNQIIDSNMEFVIMIGGNVRNSNLSGVPIIGFTDFQNADVRNLTLMNGNMIFNGSRYGVFANTMDMGDMFGGLLSIQGGLPIGCTEESHMYLDAVSDMRFGNMESGTIDCRFMLQDSNLTVYNLSFANEFGGIRSSLENSTLTIRNMTRPLNVTIYGGDTDVVFWDLNVSEFGIVVFNSDDLDVANGFASMNGTANGGMLRNITNSTRTTLIFYGIRFFDGHITYYENFTRNYSEAMEFGVECPDAICSNVIYDATEDILYVDVNMFSTYVINYTLEPPPTGGGDDRELGISVEGECAGEPVEFSASSGTSRPEGIIIDLYGPDGYVGYGTLRTDGGGEAAFIPEEPGRYHYTAHGAGYETVDGSFIIEVCIAEELPPESPEEPGEAESPGETPPAEPEITEEEPEPPVPEEHFIPAKEPAVVEEITAGEKEPVAPPAPEPEVCLNLFGICWYWWLLLLIVLAISGYYLTKRK